MERSPAQDTAGIALPAAADSRATSYAPEKQATTGGIFASLAHPNYRLWFVGQTASLVGTWTQTTAQAFLMFELTHSPAYLGYIGFASGAPFWIFTLMGGVVSDRVSRRTLLILTQLVMMTCAFILAALTFLQRVQPWHIILLALGTGIANAVDSPTRHAFVIELVSREDLSNAIALNSTMFNLAIAVGPSVAGIVYVVLGPAWCFVINGVSFLCVMAALVLMRLDRKGMRAHARSALDDLRRGLAYTAHHPQLRLLICTVTVLSIFGMGFFALLPAWAVNVLHGDSTTNGFLQSARGLGAFCGGILIAWLGRRVVKGKVLFVAFLVGPLLAIAWSQVSWAVLSTMLLFTLGIVNMFVYSLINISIQSLVSDEYRGRVMSIYTLAFLGMMPVGSLISGAIAEVWKEPITVIALSVVALIFGAWLVRVRELLALE